MEIFTILKNNLTRAAMTLLMMLAMTLTASAANFITDVMLIGHDDEDEFYTLQTSLVNQGWTPINKDLNAGCGSGSAFIHLLYKKQTSTGSSGMPITDFFIRTGSNPPANLTHEGRTYYLVPCQGSDDFVNGHGDLNEGCGSGSAYIFLYYTKDVMPSSHAVTGITFSDTQSGGVGANGGSIGYDLNSGCGSSTPYIYMHLTTVHCMVTLTSATGEIQLQNGDTLTGTGGIHTHVTIADGATVTLSGVNITSIVNNDGYQWAGLTCLGDAVIVLNGNTTNSVKGGYRSSGIYVPENKTLTLQGSGTLNATGNNWSAGIGSSYDSSCGNITISGGTVTANGGASGAGIGSSTDHSSCGNIIISGGTVTSNGGDDGAGIGSGEYVSSCGPITISGGTVTANGGGSAAGIGSGYQNSSCGNITISGGTVTVYGGDSAAGIGSGRNHSSCGTVTITDGVTMVTVTKNNSDNTIGKGNDYSTCGTVTIGGVTGFITESPFVTFPYTVAFNANGGTGTMNNQSFMYNVATNLHSNNYTRTNYEFEGWATTANGPKVYNDGQSVSNLTQTPGTTVTLYAKWIWLGTIPGELILYDGDTLTGTGGRHTHVSIADSATVTFSGVNITDILEDVNHQWPGITCLGDATIILDGGTTNSVKGGYRSSGIYVPQGYTLTLQGSGTLNATGSNWSAGIGGNFGSSCGNITISDGTITATGGGEATGIGGVSNRSCGDITISGGTVTATSVSKGAGIGSGYNNSSCGNITISGGNITATGGDKAAGIGSGEHSSCGNFTISSGNVTASGGRWAAGIGSGHNWGNCGTIFISGGNVTATGGNEAAGIGSGASASCGTVTISNSVTMVTITKGEDCNNTIGAGNDNSTCGTVTIGGVETGFITLSPFVILTKRITGYGTGTGGWHLIASPTAGNTNVEDVGGLITTAAHYDLYRFNQGAEQEWENWKAEGTTNYHFNLESGRGYLYANSEDDTLVFTGVPYTGNGEVMLHKTAGAEFEGWNLIGNPFGTATTVNKAFYRMNDEGSEIIAADNNTVAAMEGIFVIATENNETVTFTQQRGSADNGEERIVLNLEKDSTVIDRAIIRFDEGQTLPKFQIHENSTKISIPQDGKDYAIVNANGMDEIPVNFKSENNGTYTLNFSNQNVEFNYLHLIDNMTGADVDLLATPSYSFEANTNDYASRFKLVFTAGNTSNTSNTSNFAIVSDNNIIVNGEGLLQMYDVTGRIVISREVHSAFSIPNSEFTPGVYVLQLTNGNETKIQKVVVR